MSGPESMSGPGRIEIRCLRVLGTHGVLPEEQYRAQPFEVDLDLVVDLDRAADTDALADTVDYGVVVDRVVQAIAGPRSYQLLEALAAAVAKVALDDIRVTSVAVSLRKLRPPLAADVASVGVRVVRHR